MPAIYDNVIHNRL